MIELEECLLVREAAEERFGVFLGAEEADAAELELPVDGGVAELVVVAEGEAVFVEGEGDEVVCGEL